MSVREHRQGTKKIIVAKTKEEQITISTDQYASMLEEIQNLKDRVAELEEIDAARKTGMISDRLRTSIKYKVTRFVFHVQANQPIENVVSSIDRATNDICEFIANPQKAENKSMNKTVLRFDE